MSANGTSLIDYVLSYGKYFDDITHFSSGTFTMLSDLEPINFTIKFNVCFNKRNKTEITARCVDKSVKWLDDNVKVIKDRLCHNDDRLTEKVTGDFGSQSGVNTTVNNFVMLLMMLSFLCVMYIVLEMDKVKHAQMVLRKEFYRIANHGLMKHVSGEIRNTKQRYIIL